MDDLGLLYTGDQIQKEKVELSKFANSMLSAINIIYALNKNY
jgi:hypothetical protein